MRKYFSRLLSILNIVSIVSICYLKYQLMFDYGIDAHDFAWTASMWFSKTKTITWAMFIIIIIMLLVNTVYLISDFKKTGEK